MHKHTRENEISYVLEGQLSVIQNGEVQIAQPGEYIVKPKGIFHTFWNGGDRIVRYGNVSSSRPKSSAYNLFISSTSFAILG